MIEGKGIEFDDIGLAALMFCVAVTAFLFAYLLVPPVIALFAGYIPVYVLMTVQAQAGLVTSAESFMTF